MFDTKHAVFMLQGMICQVQAGVTEQFLFIPDLQLPEVSIFQQKMFSLFP